MYICSLCNTIFHTKEELIKHLKQYKNSNNELICPICNKKYSFYIQQFNKHVLQCKQKNKEQLVRKHQKFICHICNKQLKTKGALTIHTLSHDPEYRKKRSDIGKAIWIDIKNDKDKFELFRSKMSNAKKGNNYRKEYIANNQMDCNCPLCNKQFSNKISLSNHITCVHGELTKLRDFKCEICNKVFHTNKGAFINHVKSHDINWKQNKDNNIKIGWQNLRRDEYRFNQFKEKVSNNKKGSIISTESRQKISKSLKKYFNSLSDEQYSKVVVNYINAPKKGNASKHSGKYKPTDIEQLIIDLNIEGLYYNGNAKNNKTIRFNNKQYKKSVIPDFIYKDNVKFIETFGIYWHPREDEEKYINAYESNGYKVLILWEDELHENFDNCIKKIESFLEIKIER